jgi:hypothetical protein
MGRDLNEEMLAVDNGHCEKAVTYESDVSDGVQ